MKISDLSALLTETRRLRIFTFTNYLCFYILKLIHNAGSWCYEELHGGFSFQPFGVTARYLLFTWVSSQN